MAVEILGFNLSVTWLLVIATVLLFLLYDSWCHSYWWRKGLVYAPALPLVGNFYQFRNGIPRMMIECQQKYGKIFGIFDFRRPVMMVSDPEMLRHVMVKSFGKFYNRRRIPMNNKEFDSAVSILECEHWRDVRNVLTPTFSAAKMKQMSYLVNESADSLVEHIGKNQERDGFVECRDLFGSFVMDTIGSCAFGLHVDSQTNPKDPFVDNAKRAFQFSIFNPLLILVGMFPVLGFLLDLFGKGFIPHDIIDFFRDVTLKAVALRENANNESKSKKVDFLQLLVDAQKSDNDVDVEDEKDDVEQDIHDQLDRHNDVAFHASNPRRKVKLTDDEVIGQALIFFLAGYETTNTLLSYCAYLLATNPEVQEKLIREVDDMTPSRDSVGYNSIAKMPYLDQVICESLRIYPPAAMADRMCNETFTYKNLTVPKGMQIFVGIYSIHHNPDIYPDPEKFDPERFSKEEREKRHPFAWLPFGAGPRNCIGMRFALMEAKMAICRVLQKYRFETCPKTEIPPTLGKMGFLSPPNGITLRVIPRTDTKH